MSLRVSRLFVLRSSWVTLLLLALALPLTHADGWKLPFWSGELRGKLVPLGEGGPQLAWTFTPAVSSAGERTLFFRVEDLATHLRVSATVNADTHDGSWQIEEGRVEIGPWLAALAPVLAGLSGDGTILITGKGLICQGRPSGLINVLLRDGVVKHAGQGWTLEGIGIAAAVDVAALPDGKIPVTLAVRTMSTDRFGARNLLVSAVLDGTGAVSVLSARIEIAGGTVEADSFEVSLSPLALNVKLRMSGIGLQDVVALVPTMLSDARGRVDGHVGLSWSLAEGMRVGDGTLSLDEIEPTTLRLAPKPGFLSARVPARFVFIPGLPKPFSRWFSPANPAYVTLTEIELGKTPLRVQSLKVVLTPGGDERGRSASVELVARPEQVDSAVKKVVFTINVSGPLSQVLKLGMSEHLSFGVH